MKQSYEGLRPFNSWICPEKVKEVASNLGYSGNEERLVRVIDRLEKGCNIGCRGTGRLPTRHPNSKTAEEHGERVADALQGWISDGLCYGPLEETDLPWEDFTVNPITVKIKPNGKARICIDMSAPHNTANGHGTSATSVNSGINSDDFPTLMSSTKSFCESLMKAGCPGEMCKIDWIQAYKNLAVREEDHKLQIFSCGGKLFGKVGSHLGVPLVQETLMIQQNGSRGWQINCQKLISPW